MKLVHALLSVAPAAALAALGACSSGDDSSSRPGSAGTVDSESTDAATESDTDWWLETGKRPARLLSEYGLFEDPGRQTPADGVLSYDLNTPHFADYARVRRFLKLPAGETVTYLESETFQLPVGTVLAQTLSYPEDLRQPDSGERLIETRLLIHRPDGWVAAPYLWNDQMTDARKSVAGGMVTVSWIHLDGEQRTLRYLVPNSNDCKRCHEREGETVPIGLQAWNLNGELAPDGEVAPADEPVNQLAYWKQRGILPGLPEDPQQWPRQARWDDAEEGSVNDRARAWLAANCAHCHNPKGAGSVSGLDLSRVQANPIRYGVYKPPVSAGRGSVGLRYSVAPGRPEDSFLLRRLQSTDPSIMMPPVGRRTPHEEGIALIREWISQMSFEEKETERLKVEQQRAYELLQQSGEWEEQPPG